MLTIFQLNHICHGCWKIVGSKFQCIIVHQSWGGPNKEKTTGKICPLLSTKIGTFSPGLENNDTLKCWSNNNPTTLTYVVRLENCLKNISINGCSPIKGKRVLLLLKFYEARISECNTGRRPPVLKF